MRRGPWFALLCLAACAGRPPDAFKPGAPAAVSLAARPLGDGRFELTLAATARADLDDLILELRLPDGVTYTGGELVRPVGRATAGQTATLVAEVAVAGHADVVGGARLRGGGAHGAVATSVAVGEAAAKPLAAPRVVSTPLGRVTEARP